jgi:hypothetical protein
MSFDLDRLHDARARDNALERILVRVFLFGGLIVAENCFVTLREGVAAA